MFEFPVPTLISLLHVFPPAMKPRRRSTRRKNRRGPKMCFEEAFTFSVEAGHSITVLNSTLSNRPPRSNFRPLWLDVEVCGFVPSTAAAEPTSFEPIGCQIAIVYGSIGSTSNAVSVSPIKLVTNTPRRIRVRNRPQEDWITFDQPPSTQIASISAVCVGSPGTGATGYLRGVARMRFSIQSEVVVPSCPTLTHLCSDSAPSPSSVSSSSSNQFHFVTPHCSSQNPVHIEGDAQALVGGRLP